SGVASPRLTKARSCHTPWRNADTTEIRLLGYHPRVMGFSDVWNRTLVYFGIAEDEEWDEDGLETQEELEREYRSRSSRQNVRRLPRGREPEGWTDESTSVEQPSAPVSTSSRSRS